MKNLKFLFVAVILTLFIGVTQTKAQAHVERGTEIKPLVFEIDGEQYFAFAEVEFQFEGTPSLNFNWVSHGHLIEVYKDGVLVEDIKFKKAIKAYDPRGFDEKVTITPNGKVNVTAHVKDIAPWW